jgi:hypothetical protein
MSLLDDFIPTYEDQNDSRIQYEFARKYEFTSEWARLREPIPKRGSLYHHQKQFLRYAINYDAILNISETGTGKTCEYVAVSEYFKKHPGRIRRVIILQKPSTISDTKNQIVCRCTDGEYETDIVKRAKNITVRKGNITRELKKWYDIYSYYRFAAMIDERQMTDAEIEAEYSDCLFIIDEAHSLRNGAEDITDEENQRNTQTYNTIKRVLQKAKRVKKIVNSATPIINTTKEAATMINLLNDEDNQLPLSWDYNKISFWQLEPYIRGKVLFVRNLETGAVPSYQGNTIDCSYNIEIPDPNWAPEKTIKETLALGEGQPQPPMIKKNVKSKTIVYALPMGKLQDKIYQQALLNKDQQFHSDKQQTSAFVFPDGSYGGNFPRLDKEQRYTGIGLGKYVMSTKPEEYVPTPEFKAQISDYDSLYNLSCKFAETVRIVKNEPGNAFVYTDFVAGGGVLSLAVCLEAAGFVRFDESHSVFLRNDAISQNSSICSNSATTRAIRPDFKKGVLRYGILTRKSEIPEPKQDTLLELFNSKENMHGEYCKAVIGSEVTRDGINLFNVLIGILLTVGWHHSGMHQALSRFLRSVSHDDLIQWLREEYIKIGRDPAEAELEVKIYKMAAMPSVGMSIDLELYQYAEKKELFNRLIIMRYLKMGAADCMPNYRRNVKDTDEDYSIECDYDVCKYPCYNAPEPTPDELDFTTFDLLYPDEAIESCILDIIGILQIQGSITLKELYKRFTNVYREKFIIMSIDRLMTEKRRIPDRFGYGCYINSDGFQVFTQREFPVHGSIEWQDLSFYGKDIIGVSATPFDQIVENLQSDEQMDIVDRIGSLDDPTEGEDRVTFNHLIKSLSLPSKVALLEQTLTQFASGNHTTVGSAVMKKFEWYTFYTLEPYEDIATQSEALINQGQLKGKKAHLQYKGEPKEGEIKPNGKPVEGIYLHSLFSTDLGLTAYVVTTKFIKAEGRIRIYKPSEGVGWRDANVYETPVYASIIQTIIQKRMEPYETFPIYGTILNDDVFRIRDKTKIDVLEVNDGRGDRRGRECKLWNKPDLIDLVLNENITPQNIADIAIPETSREDMIRYLIKSRYTNDTDKVRNLSLNSIALIVKWYRSKVSREGMCQVIQQHFAMQGRLLITEPS